MDYGVRAYGYSATSRKTLSTGMGAEMKRKIPFVMVKWLDAADSTKTGWHSKDELTEVITQPVACYSTGWVLKKTKADLIIAADWSPSIKGETEPDWSRASKIPRKMIVEVREMANPYDIQPEEDEEDKKPRPPRKKKSQAEPTPPIES